MNDKPRLLFHVVLGIAFALSGSPWPVLMLDLMSP